MHSTFHHCLVTARIADLHDHAARERTIKAAVRARRPQPHHRARLLPGATVTGLTRRARILARDRSPAPTQ